MNAWALAVAGVVFGAAHAAHCAAMCGVFALAARRPWAFTAYALGKTCTYAWLGALAGVAGVGVHALAHPALVLLVVVAGLALVAGGYRFGFGVPRAPENGWPARLTGALARRLGDLRSRHLPGGRFTLGALSGALPCGAVALALVQAAVAGDAPRGMLFMTAFGLGTLPALAAVVLLAGPLSTRLPAPLLRRAGGVLVMLAGLLTLLRAGLPAGDCCP